MPLDAPVQPAAAAAEPARSTDAQVWTELDLVVPVSPTVGVTGTAVARIGNGVPNPTLWGGGATVDWRVSHRWTLTAGAYLVAARSAANGARVGARIPLAAVAYSFPLGRLELADRSRIERIDGVPGAPWRYRNRLSASLPMRRAGPIAAVFAADEVFYDFGRGRWSRNRAQVGATLKPIGPVRPQIYLMRQDDRFSRPGTLNILGIGLQARL